MGYIGRRLWSVYKICRLEGKHCYFRFLCCKRLVSTLGTIYSVESSSEDSGKVLEARIQDKETV
ncbi:hypothetical protein [Treponema sp. OMZ 791]|uniref:hypothetical protein n=1 Tax=Treponema sp. OMZ 791 TaxID=2563666 RepID=UPI0020A54606|nr:hypothetical protein [Treponema sp. OMZ 791]